ncbi:flavodoxin family protein [Heliobacterium gestii]|uniref:Flavodoxin family protein n=1 Tax=Heliomicrobium gestii TaxID=2699 RepID=A0A845L5V9_HELGE|nr:NAD(P)H-dependent oxidoreductase [Heliomicrobium gestii]MBM7865781.1 NAD(P)H dehydrogenase (quinone) [Heliomicrobium gestii]MZP42027.1 flavodoxin family protein [Heliomicrobium gestii]
MNHLILFAHPNPKSFNAAILETTVTSLEGKGHRVVVRDLYKLNFDPILKGTDFEVFQSGRKPADVEVEHDHIQKADVITMIYPIWWSGMPAILKGYIDRVFSYGFAYRYNDEGVPVGLLAGKNGLIINTQGNTTDYYDSIGMTGAVKLTTDTSIFGFCGIEPVDHLFFGAVPTVDDATRQGMLKTLRERLDQLF